MAQVVLTNVTKVYPGDVLAVKDVSLNIADREFIVLVGPSGCGKSTTLRMVAGLEEITAGQIAIGQRVVNDVPPKDRDIAMVFQNYALYPHMSVYKNLAFALKLRKMPKAQIDQRVRAAAKVLGIEELLERKPKALSGGQRQRVAVGRAIVRQPKAFLFDEPLSNLDAKLRVEMRAELKRLHRQLQTTTLYVTHDQEEAMTLGDRIVVMKDGVVHQVGSPLEVFSRPVNHFVAGFVGTPPMNFLSGKLTGADGGVWFDQGNFRIGLGDEHARRLARHLGKEVVLGVRPEAMSLSPQGRFAAPAGKEGANAVPAQIVVIEPLGEKMDLYLTTEKPGTGTNFATARNSSQSPTNLVARVDASENLQAGQPAQLFLDLARVHIFEPGPEGANISLG